MGKRGLSAAPITGNCREEDGPFGFGPSSEKVKHSHGGHGIVNPYELDVAVDDKLYKVEV